MTTDRPEMTLDAEKLIAELKDLHQRFVFQGGSPFALGIASLLAENKRLREELAAAQKDAAEYRRLRQAWLDVMTPGMGHATMQENRDDN